MLRHISTTNVGGHYATDCIVSVRKVTHSSACGFSLIELLVVLALAAIILGICAANFKSLSSDIQNASSQTAGFIKRVRSQAVASTSAYKVVSSADGKQLITSYSNSCDDSAESFVTNSKLTLTMPKSVSIKSPSFCITPRGMSRTNALINVVMLDGSQARTIEVALGGAVKIHE